MNDKKIQERLLREEDLDLEKATQIVWAAEGAKEQTQEIGHGFATKITTQVEKQVL